MNALKKRFQKLVQRIAKNLTPIKNLFLYGAKNPDKCLTIRLGNNGMQHIRQLQEKSGVEDLNALMRAAFAYLDMLVDHELQGGTVMLVEENGVNKQPLELLRQLSREDDNWKDSE